MRSAPEHGPIGKVLVTGGAGFIGSALSQLVGDRAERWVVVDNLHPQVHPTADRPAALHEAAELVVADVVEAGTWDRVLADLRPDVVVHPAAETGTAQSLSESTRNRLPILSEDPLPRSVAKCEEFAALPPLPKQKICRSSATALFKRSINRATCSTGMESSAAFCARI